MSTFYTVLRVQYIYYYKYETSKAGGEKDMVEKRQLCSFTTEFLVTVKIICIKTNICKSIMTLSNSWIFIITRAGARTWEITFFFQLLKEKDVGRSISQGKRKQHDF